MECSAKRGQVASLPENTDLALAAMIDPFAVTARAVLNVGFRDEEWEEESVLVIGGGPIGEPTEKRVERCREVPGPVVDSLREDVGSRCKEVAGEGMDVVFDRAGMEGGLKDGFEALKGGGTYMNVTGWMFVVPQHPFLLKEITIKASCAYTENDFKEAVDGFCKGYFVETDKCITGRVLLEDVVENAFEELLSNKDDHVKILVSPKKDNFGQ